MTRQEHIQWCKERAIQEIEYSGDPQQGVISIMSDLGKHDETRSHPGIQLGVMLMLGGQLKTKADVVKFIEGFN